MAGMPSFLSIHPELFFCQIGRYRYLIRAHLKCFVRNAQFRSFVFPVGNRLEIKISIIIMSPLVRQFGCAHIELIMPVIRTNADFCKVT